MPEPSLVQVLAGLGAVGSLGAWAEVVRRNRNRSIANEERSKLNTRRLTGDEAMDEPSIGAELRAIKEDTAATRRGVETLTRSHVDLVGVLESADSLAEADFSRVDEPVQPDGGEEEKGV